MYNYSSKQIKEMIISDLQRSFESSILFEEKKLSLTDIERILRSASELSIARAKSDSQEEEPLQPQEEERTVPDGVKEEVRKEVLPLMRKIHKRKISHLLRQGDETAVRETLENVSNVSEKLQDSLGTKSVTTEYAQKLEKLAKQQPAKAAIVLGILIAAQEAVDQKKPEMASLAILQVAHDRLVPTTESINESAIVEQDPDTIKPSKKLATSAKKADVENLQRMLSDYEKAHGDDKTPETIDKFLKDQENIQDPARIARIRNFIRKNVKSVDQRKVDNLMRDWQNHIKQTMDQSSESFYKFLQNKGFTDKQISAAMKAELGITPKLTTIASDATPEDLPPNRKTLFYKMKDIVSKMSSGEKRDLLYDMEKALSTLVGK